MAHRDHVATWPLAEVERVEGDDLVHVGRREIEERGDVFLGLERDVAEGLLRHVEHGQQRAARVGIERLEPADLAELRL